jgi:hypothetical protein
MDAETMRQWRRLADRAQQEGAARHFLPGGIVVEV